LNRRDAPTLQVENTEGAWGFMEFFLADEKSSRARFRLEYCPQTDAQREQIPVYGKKMLTSGTQAKIACVPSIRKQVAN
jgi:hypothetical protein